MQGTTDESGDAGDGLFARAIQRTDQVEGEAALARARFDRVVKDALAYTGGVGLTLCEPSDGFDGGRDGWVAGRDGVRIDSTGTWYRRAWSHPAGPRDTSEEVIGNPVRYFTLTGPQAVFKGHYLQHLRDAPPGHTISVDIEMESRVFRLEGIDLETLFSPEKLAALFFVDIVRQQGRPRPP